MAKTVGRRRISTRRADLSCDDRGGSSSEKSVEVSGAGSCGFGFAGVGLAGFGSGIAGNGAAIVGDGSPAVGDGAAGVGDVAYWDWQSVQPSSGYKPIMSRH